MDMLVIAASSVTCAHTQQDGKYTVALTDPKMDGFNKLAKAKRGHLAVVSSFETF